MTRTASGLVSVIVPTFNAAPWLQQALDSIHGQDYPAHEIIVADSGSADDTLQIARDVAPEATIVAARVPGPAAARNAGLDAARGEYLQFLDSDDMLAPGKLSRHVEAIERSGAHVVWGDFEEVAAESTSHAVLPRRRRVPRIAGDVASALIGPDGFIQLGAALFRRRGAVATARFDEAFRVVEDVRYLVTIALGGSPFASVPGPPGLYWRQHSLERASNVGPSTFWLACAANADLVAAATDDGDAAVATARKRAAARVWLEAAEVLATRGDRRTREILERLDNADARWRDQVRSPHRLLLPLLGFERTFRLSRVLHAMLGGHGANPQRAVA